jgi:hypothetical protein
VFTPAVLCVTLRLMKERDDVVIGQGIDTPGPSPFDTDERVLAKHSQLV